MLTRKADPFLNHFWTISPEKINIPDQTCIALI